MLREDSNVDFILPIMTSHETVAVMQWLVTDPQHFAHWSKKAEEMVQRYGMEMATHQLSALLCDRVMSDVECAPGLGQTLMEATVRRVNFFELAVALLRPYDVSGYFEWQLIQDDV